MLRCCCIQGAFAELWEALGISSGDTLIFKRDLPTGRIELARHAASNAVKAEEVGGWPIAISCCVCHLTLCVHHRHLALPFPLQGADSDLSDPSAVEGSGGRGARGVRQEASSEQTRGQSQQGSHPNRWMELADGWNIKTVYKSTMVHQQCPIAGGRAMWDGLLPQCWPAGSAQLELVYTAPGFSPPAGWLFKKLYGRLPGENDRAAMYDPDLDAEYRFDVSFISAGESTGLPHSCTPS